jgi:uncharacterized membrane protein (UPF0127 family)
MTQQSRILNYHLLACLIFFTGSCKEGTIEPTPQPNASFPFRIEDKTVEAEIAIKPSEREKGLMHRDSMPRGKGMLFVFEQPSSQKFWMKNTRIPLDIGYFSPSGKLLEVHAAKPYDLHGVPSRSKNIQFALELNLNGFREMGIRIGSRLNLSDVSEALTSRGFDPRDYGFSP